MSDEMQGPPPNPLFLERMGRIMTAVACGTPDRVPVSLVMDTFACRTMGVKVSDFVSDVDLAAQTMLGALEKLDGDSVQFATYQPDVLGMVWLNPMRLPGRELPEDTLWQMDEQVRMTPEDYDRILEMGWGPWFGQYVGQHLGASAAAMQRLAEGAPRWVPEYMKRGYVVVSPGVPVDQPYEHLSGGRTVQEFTLDLFHQPNKVQAVIEAIMVVRREEARQMVRAIGPYGYWIGSWRSAPQFLSPKMWDRFVWPYLKELVEIVAEEGGMPILHFDSNWDREIERLLELPARKCILALDGQTDIFRAKRILAGHMCIMGDVPPGLLTLGSVDEVKTYCDRLLTEVGPDGYIMAMGCAVPMNAKFENVKAMVDSVQGK